MVVQHRPITASALHTTLQGEHKTPHSPNPALTRKHLVLSQRGLGAVTATWVSSAWGNKEEPSV